MKICTKCNLLKDESEFYLAKYTYCQITTEKFTNQCKSCRKITYDKWSLERNITKPKKTKWKKIKINNKIEEVFFIKPEKCDKERTKRNYFDWLNLNQDIKKQNSRGINLPECISEKVFCLAFPKCQRVLKLKYAKKSFDVLNMETGKRIQIKATSTKNDCTSFGPHSEWDELYFLDFSSEDGNCKIYLIDSKTIYEHAVNKNQIFTQQQEQGRRPRLSIIQKIIQPNNLQPISNYQL